MPSSADKIDVCIPTWNSDNTLDRCLKSIINEIPVNSIRILDNLSTDNTVKIARKYDALITQEKCGIGEARQLLVESVTTEYFAFIDSDIVLREGWFKAVMETMKSNEKIGAVGGLFFSDNPQDRHFWEIMIQRTRADNPMWERGANLNNSLIKMQSIKGISIPKWMINYEDKFIRMYLVSRGYKWVVERKAICDHLVGESSFWKTCLGRRYYGAGLRLWKDVDPNASERKIVLRGPLELFLATHAAVKAGDPLIIPFKFFTLLFTLAGYVGSSGKLLDEIEKDVGYKRQYSKFRRN